MNDGDLFDAVKPDDDAKRPETTGGESLFDDRTTSGEEAAELPEAAEPAADAKIVDVTPKPKPAAAPREIPAEPVPPRRPAQELPQTSSLGAALAELRRRRGMSLAEAAAESRIKQHYIEELEADDLSDLPQLVYVIGFVKRLCVIYGVSAKDAETLVADLPEQIDYEIPEDIKKSVICRAQDEANHRRLRNLTVALVAGVVLILAALILGGAVLVLKLRNGGAKPAAAPEPEVAAQPAPAPVTVDEAMLMSYHERPKLNVSRIPAAR